MFQSTLKEETLKTVYILCSMYLCLKYFVLKVSLLPSINKIKRDINSNRSHFLNCQIASLAYLLPVNKKTIAKFSGIGVTRFHSLYIQILLVSTKYVYKKDWNPMQKYVSSVVAFATSISNRRT